ncbi:hypothetical protein LPJ73_008227, partial [Coemansia sp. RSA 2703]
MAAATATTVPAMAATQGRSVFLRKHADEHTADEDCLPSRGRVPTSSSQTVVAALSTDDSGGEQPSAGLEDSADEPRETSMATTAHDATATASGSPSEGTGSSDTAVTGVLASTRSNGAPNGKDRPGTGVENDYAEMLGAYYDDYLPIVGAGRAVSGEKTDGARNRE